ncbi:anhydro-N-acetylmuramic acid kinase [Aliihoeflea sp. PC F10.4]
MALLRALGLMSGTSMDGIDLALIKTDGETSVERGPSMFVAYDAAFRRRIEAGLDDAKAIVARTERPGDLALLERELTMRHATAVAAFVERYGAVDLVGFHGQTVLHRPERALTVQIGDGALLARETDIPVVYDMRAADMEAGGQGAPLVPAYHAALAETLREIERPICFVNIGGISNVTFVPADGPPIAFDSGPGNALIDQWVAREGGVPFDQNGMIASEGGIVARVVERYMANPFFDREGPKSLDRNDFTLDESNGLDLSDGARTLAAVSARAILKAAEHLPQTPKTWVLCGGGRKNPHIVADMRSGAPDANVLLAEDVGLDGDSMEAEAWAYLAVRSQKRLPLTWPTTTGCRLPVIGGVNATP